MKVHLIQVYVQTCTVHMYGCLILWARNMKLLYYRLCLCVHPVAVQNCYVLDLLADSELGQCVLRMGVELCGAGSSGVADGAGIEQAAAGAAACDVEDELCQSVVLILFIVCWKGVVGSDDDAWQVRLVSSSSSPLPRAVTSVTTCSHSSTMFGFLQFFRSYMDGTQPLALYGFIRD